MTEESEDMPSWIIALGLGSLNLMVSGMAYFHMLSSVIYNPSQAILDFERQTLYLTFFAGHVLISFGLMGFLRTKKRTTVDNWNAKEEVRKWMEKS